MKEKIVLTNLLKYLSKDNSYYFKVPEPGIYLVESYLKLKLEEFSQYSSRTYITIDLNNETIHYELKRYLSGIDSIITGTADWNQQLPYIIEQCSSLVKRSLDAAIKQEDADRLAKSRNCRVNRKFIQLTDAV